MRPTTTIASRFGLCVLLSATGLAAQQPLRPSPCPSARCAPCWCRRPIPQRSPRCRRRPGQDPKPTEQDPAAKAAAALANKRLQAFKKLVFDRRPSSVLAAWAAPELKPYDPAEDEKAEGKGAEGKAESGKPAGAPTAAEPAVTVAPIDPAAASGMSAEEIRALIERD